MFDIGGTEGLIIVLAILLLFGAKRIPDLARSMGAGMKEFRRAMREISDEVSSATSPDEPAAHAPAAPSPPSLTPPDRSVGRASSAPPASPPAAQSGNGGPA